MSKPINIQDSVTLYPSGVASDYAYASISNQGNAYNASSNTTYATINLTTGSNAVTYIYYTFNTSSIPANATIDSITCSAKAYISTTNSSRITSRQIQLYSGTTAKGSAYTVSNSTTAFSMTPGNSWTRSELNDLRIRLYAVRGTSNTTSTYYFRFYGATLTINYSIQGTAYTITATSSVPAVTVEPATQDIMAGESGEVHFYADSITDYTVTDNSVDVTNLLVYHQEPPQTTTISQTAESYETGFSATNINFYTSSSSQGHNFQYAVGHTAESPGATSSGSGSWTYVKTSSGSTTATGYADYSFDFSGIPSNATITSVAVRVYGAVEDSSQTTSHSEITLYSGSTAKTTTQSFTSSTNSIMTISNPGTWTRAELQNAKLRFTVGYYGGHMFGATWQVTYTTPATEYYLYVLDDIDDDHVILLEEAGAFIPPEEDPQKTYYPITISSINAMTDPGTGTTRVLSGTNQTITITPTDPQLTLALDNGVDITSQLVGGVPSNTYTINTQVSGASYGFNLNSSTGYYVSTNNGVAKSASVARINMDFESSCIVTIQYINYAEANYDYGMFGKLDTAVATDGLTANSSIGTSSPSDSTSNYLLAMCSNSSSAQTISYTVPAGLHFIDVKYGKDDGTDSNNDNLQWKISSILATSAGGDYTYTLSNINQKHSLIFVFGNVNYYFITSSGGSNCKLFPDGQTVKLLNDDYKLTIIPNDSNATVSITDNNVDRTSLLEYQTGQDKYGNTVVNYIYTLTNINATHNLIITCGGQSVVLYLKTNSNTYTAVTRIWKKTSFGWVEQSDLSTLFNSNIKYVWVNKT